MTNIKLLESNIYLPDNGTEVLVCLDSRIELILYDSSQIYITLHLYVDFFCSFLLFYIGRSPTASKLMNKNNPFYNK